MEKENKKLYAVGFGLVLLLSIVFMIRFVAGDEDSWICVNGQWQEHGKPDTQMPSTPCR